ncbi:MAG: flagellar protein FlgN [bacterium]
MQEVIKDLEKILNAQISVYSDMENHISQKKEILVKNDIESLKTVDIEIERLAKTIQSLEAKRVQVLSTQPHMLNQPLSKVAELTSSPKEKQIILSLKDKLIDVMLRVKKANDLNAELIAHSIKLVQHTALLIGNALNPEGSAYNRNGKGYKSNSSNNSISSVIRDV